MAMKRLHHQAPRNEYGLVSIVATATIVALLALIVIGFARLMSRELRQSLDRQLSSQAYYAAESGINDAKNYLADLANDPSNPQPITKTNCDNPPPNPDGLRFMKFFKDLDVNPNSGAKYTCVLLNPNPKVLNYGPSFTTETRLSFLTNAGGDQLIIAWRPSKDAQSGFRPDLSLTTFNTWNAMGLLRLTIFTATDQLNTSRAELQSTALNLFLVPVGGGTVGNYDVIGYAGSNGKLVQGRCVNSGVKTIVLGTSTYTTNSPCVIVISGLPAGTHIVKMKDIYAPVDKQFQIADAGGDPATFTGGPVEVDVTGRGTDVVKRLSTTLQPELTGGNLPGGFQNALDFLPDYAIESAMSICKLIRVPDDGSAPFPDDPLAASDPESCSP